MLTHDRRAMPGILITLAGALVCAALWGWHEAVIFGVGGALGSTRYNG